MLERSNDKIQQTKYNRLSFDCLDGTSDVTSCSPALPGGENSSRGQVDNSELTYFAIFSLHASPE